LPIAEVMPMPPGLKDGDRLRFRLRATDNRQLPKAVFGGVPREDLAPQRCYEPAPENDKDRWVELRVDATVPPLLARAIFSERDHVHSWIEELRKTLDQQRKGVGKLQSSTDREDGLTEAQKRSADEISYLSTASLDRALRWLATEPQLAAVAEKLLELRREELAQVQDGLQKFVQPQRPKDRRKQDLEGVQAALAQALKKLEALAGKNQALAQDRLDLLELERLAQRQDELRQRLQEARAEEGKTPRPDMERLRAEQERLEADLEALRKQSQLLREALEARRGAEAQRLSRVAEQMAADQRQNAREVETALQRLLAQHLAELRSRQQELMHQAEKLAAESGGPAQLQQLREAFEALRQGKLAAALEEQRRGEDALRGLAEQLRQALELGPEPRQAVTRLAREQQAVHDDLLKLGEEYPRLKEKELRDRLSALTARQQALQDLLGKLKLAPADAQVEQARSAARQARQLLEAKNALAAVEAMEKAQQSLDAVARRLPEQPSTPDAAAAAKKKIEQMQALADDQQRLRAAGQKLLTEAEKMATKQGEAMGERAKRLAEDVLQLARSGATPEAQRQSEESARAVQEARQAMQEAHRLQAQGQMEQARKPGEDAALKLERAGKQLGQMSPPSPSAPRSGEEVALSLQEGMLKVQQAREQLGSDAARAVQSMQQASQSLAQAARRAQQSLAGPSAAAARPGTTPAPGTGTALGLPVIVPGSEQARPWGELPGELKTRLVQDLRSRYGEDYAEVIRRYFERLADVPMTRSP
jgi:hypothetical protein